MHSQSTRVRNIKIRRLGNERVGREMLPKKQNYDMHIEHRNIGKKIELWQRKGAGDNSWMYLESDTKENPWIEKRRSYALPVKITLSCHVCTTNNGGEPHLFFLLFANEEKEFCDCQRCTYYWMWNEGKLSPAHQWLKQMRTLSHRHRTRYAFQALSSKRLINKNREQRFTVYYTALVRL